MFHLNDSVTRRHNYRPWHVLCLNDWQPASVKEGAENCLSSKITCQGESCLTAGEAFLITAVTTVVPLDHTAIKEIWFWREGSNIEVLMLWSTNDYSSLYGSIFPDPWLSWSPIKVHVKTKHPCSGFYHQVSHLQLRIRQLLHGEPSRLQFLTIKGPIHGNT